MKRCVKCNKTYGDESLFCVHCGAALSTVQECICSHCGCNVSGEDKFCPKCGTELKRNESIISNVQENDTAKQNHTKQDNDVPEQAESISSTEEDNDVPEQAKSISSTKQDNDVPEQTEFKFSYENKFGNVVVTEIKANENILDIVQYKKFYGAFKYGEERLSLNIYDINDVITKKSIQFTSVLLIMISLLIATEKWYGLLGVVLGVIFLKGKNLYIYFKNGYIKIPEANSFAGDIELFKQYISKYNPDCINYIVDK